MLVETLRALLRLRRLVPAIFVTALTLAIAGGVFVTTTSAGCGTASKLGLKSSVCVRSKPVAGVTAHPSASGGLMRSPAAPMPSSIPPAAPDQSSYPPYTDPTSPGFSLPSASPFPFPPIPGYVSGTPVQPSVPLSCRLPVSEGSPGSGYFVAFPGGTLIADPRSWLNVPPSTDLSSPPFPYGGYEGWYGLTYDAAYTRWVPVPYAWVSPDGVHYAYDWNGSVYVHNLADGTLARVAAGRNFRVLSVETDGIYAIDAGGPGSAPLRAGLWFLPYAGAPKQVTTSGDWQAESHGFAFGITTPANQGAQTTIVRLDVGTGAIANWYTSQPGARIQLLGFDAVGDPVIEATYSNGFALWIAVSPSDLRGIAWGYTEDGSSPVGPVVADGHGLWVSTYGGLDLYANGRWYLMADSAGQLTGACV